MRHKGFWLFFLLSLRCAAQTPYGNEWIRPEQQYLRLAITQKGLFRLSPADLQKQGINPGGIAAQSLQLYRRGQEVAIHVNGEQDGRLDSSDYIEFYGQPNDGWPDTLLYVTPRAMPHPYYSLYSDTAAYFLTWRPLDQSGQSFSGKRIQEVAGLPTPARAGYHQEKVLQVFKNEYPAGNIYPFGAGYDDGYILTPYDTGEGWTGPTRRTGQWEVFRLQTESAVRNNFSEAGVEILFVGRNASNHQVEVWTGDASRQGRKLGEITWNNYETRLFRASLLPEDLTESGMVTLAYVPRTAGESVSASYVAWTYPQQLAPERILTQKTLYPVQGMQQGLESAEGLRFYDVTLPAAPRRLVPDPTGGVWPQQSEVLLVVRQPLSVTSMRPVKFKSIDSTRTDYLIISHPLVRKPVADSRDPVADYAAYRASSPGGGFTPLVVNSEEVADQFNYGEPGPNGTRRLMRWLHVRGNLRYTFLIGKSRSPQIVRQQANARNDDMVPNAGWPDSDIALGMGLDPEAPNVPLVPIGRLNAYNSQNVWDYLQKVKQHEAAPPALPWRKNILHLSGGRSAYELTTFRNFVDDYAARIDFSAVAPRLQTLSKKTDEPVEKFALSPLLNEGVALITMFGHSNLNVTDIDIGFASNDALGYRNKGRYPAVLVNGCALGNFYFGPTPISTDWILAPDRGAVLFLAHTHNGLSGTLYRYSKRFYEVLSDTAFTSRGFGDIMREGIRRYMATDSLLPDRITAQQMNLQGDPAIRIFPATRPDYTWEPSSLRITNVREGKISAWDDSLMVQARVVNNGRLLHQSYSIRVLRRRGSQILADTTLIRPAIPLRDSLRILLPNNSRQGGDDTWELILDPQNGISEEDETNNLLLSPIQVAEGGAIALLPANRAIVRTPQVELVAQVPSSRANTPVVFEWADSADFGPGTRRDTLRADGVLARHLLTLTGPAPQRVYWRVRIAGDPAPSYQQFRYDTQGADSIPPLPEGIAILSAAPARQLEEGAVLTARITFENISQTPFADSIQVLVRELGAGAISEKRFYIPPLKGKTAFLYNFNGGTLGKAGENRTLIYFNAGQLPEQLLLNNAVELVYTVLPDQTPPVLDVLVDGRRLSDREAVSPQPRLNIRIFDSNSYLMRKDTTGLRISLQQDCDQCPGVPVSLDKAVWSPQPAADFGIALDLPSLAPGTYLLTVQARDVKGNEAAPYRIRFRVVAQNQVVMASATPNPATLWVKFSLELEGTVPPLAWRVHLYDLSGKEIAMLEKSPTLGNNEFFWVPQGMAPGQYLYKMELEGPGWTEKNLPAGKILFNR